MTSQVDELHQRLMDDLVDKQLESLYHRLVKALKNDEPWTVLDAMIATNPRVLLYQDGENGFTPLHVAVLFCRPVKVIRYLVQKCPKALEIGDTVGSTPLALAFHAVALRVDTVLLLLEAYPKAAERADHLQRLPLHYACRANAPVQVIRRLLEVYPESAQRKADGGCGPLLFHAGNHCHDNNFAVFQLLLDADPQEAKEMQTARWGISLLHHVCRERTGVLIVQYVAPRWPVACLLCYRDGWIHYNKLPLESSELWQPASLEVIQFMTETTIEAVYGWMDAMFHPRSSFPQDIVDMIAKSLPSQVVATIKANGMMRDEAIDLLTIKELLRDEAVQTMLLDETNAAVIHGFIQMNKAGRKEAVKQTSDKLDGIAVCASVSDDICCLFAHLRENPSICAEYKDKQVN